jgi:phosphatidyl-myo-inositol alpha-mannosyltransferase
MKIALVSPYDFAYPGGVVNHITALERQLTRLGHDVRVIAPASQFVPDFGERFIPIGKPRPVPASGSIARISLSLRLASKIKEVLEREQFDIIHLHEPFMPMLCSAVLRFSQIPSIGTFHACAGRPGYYFGWPISAFMIKRRTVKLKNKICVSLAAMRYTRKWVHGDYEIIPNGIDLDLFSPKVAPFPEFKDGKLNVLFVGRLESRKGLIYLLKAYRSIKRDVPKSRLIVVGPGKRLRSKYEKWVTNNHLDDVVFVGYTSQEELPRYYQTADIFCAPATGRESFGIVLLEAMAMGKPIVATSIEGYRCVLTSGVEGILVRPKNDKEIAKAILRLIANPTMRRKMGDNGRQKAQQYGWKRIAKRVLDCYTKVLNESRGQKHPVLESASTR